MVILPKDIYRFNIIPIKNSKTIIYRAWKNNTQLHMDKQQQQQTQGS